MSTGPTSLPLSEKLFRMMESENRPFSFNDIQKRMGESIAKVAIQKSIELLVAKERMVEKTYGKQKIYCVNNKLSKVNSEALKNLLRTLDEKILKYTTAVNEKQERIKVIEAQLKKDSNDVPLPILEAEHEALVDTVNKLQSQADEMKQRNGPTLDPAVFMKLQQERDKKLQEFHKRKRLSLNMIDAIMEGYPKSKQKLIEDTEIETDEAAGFDINQYK